MDNEKLPKWEKSPEGQALGSYAVDNWYIPEEGYEDWLMRRERLEASAKLANPQVVADAVYYCMEWGGMKAKPAMMAVQKAIEAMQVSLN